MIALALATLALAPGQMSLRVNLSSRTVANGGSLKVDVYASRRGHLRVALRRGRRCPASFTGGNQLLARRSARQLHWRGGLDEVIHPGRYTVCAVVKPPKLGALAAAAPLHIRR